SFALACDVRRSTLFPYTTLFRSRLRASFSFDITREDGGRRRHCIPGGDTAAAAELGKPALLSRHGKQIEQPCGRSRHERLDENGDRKSTRLNSSHRTTSYAVLCL